MLQPTRTKFRKAHKGRIHGTASRCNVMNYGSFGLKAIQPERIISRHGCVKYQINYCGEMTRSLKKKLKKIKSVK